MRSRYCCFALREALFDCLNMRNGIISLQGGLVGNQSRGNRSSVWLMRLFGCVNSSVISSGLPVRNRGPRKPDLWQVCHRGGAKVLCPRCPASARDTPTAERRRTRGVQKDAVMVSAGALAAAHLAVRRRTPESIRNFRELSAGVLRSRTTRPVSACEERIASAVGRVRFWRLLAFWRRTAVLVPTGDRPDLRGIELNLASAVIAPTRCGACGVARARRRTEVAPGWAPLRPSDCEIRPIGVSSRG